MAADMFIHVYEGLTEEDMRDFFSCSIGSKYFDIDHHVPQERWNEMYDKLNATDKEWVGSVSWLKADIMNDPETFIPNTIGEISELIGENLPVVSEELIQKILAAFDKPNNTGYALADKSDIEKFLRLHMGERIFYVGW